MPNWETLVDGDDHDLNKYLDFREYDTLADRDAASASFGSEAMFHICRVVETGYYYWWQGASWIPFSALGGAGAPPSCSFVTINAEADLSAETLHKNIVGANLHVTKAHASEHQSGGGDPIKLDDLSAPDDNVDLNASTTKHGLLKKLDNDGAHYMDGQGNWTAPPGGGAHDLGGAQHVADSLADVSAKITDATLIDSVDVQFKTGALHSAADHQVGWPLELNVTGLSGVLADEQDAGQVKGVTVDDAAKADGKVLGYVAGSGNIEYVAAPAPGAHAATHQNGGGDEVNVTGLSGELADNQPPKTHKNTHKTGGGDAFVVADELDALARVEVKLGGVSKGKRRGMNFTNTPSVTWAITDDAGNEEVDIQATATNAGAYKLSPSYVCYKVGGTYYAMDEDGNIDYSGAAAATVINNAMGNLTAGRDWKEKVLVKGDITISAKLSIPSYTILQVDGKITLANGSNVYMAQNSDTGGGNVFIDVIGGEWDANKAGQGAVNLKGIQFTKVNDGRIVGVYLHDVKADTMAGGRGLEFYGCQRCKMIDCRVEDSDHNDYGVSDGYDCQIVHCFSKGAANASFSCGSVDTDYCDRHRVSDCTALEYGNHGFELYKECHHCHIVNCHAYSTVVTADAGFKIGNVGYPAEPSNDNLIADCTHRYYGSGFVVDRGFRNTVANCRSYDATKYGVLIQGAAQSGYNQIDTFTAYSPTWEVLKIDAAKNLCMNIKGHDCGRNGVEIMDDGDENTISGAHITDMVANNPLKLNAGASRNFITGFNMYGNSADVADAGANTMWGTNVDKDGNVDTNVEP